jgi:propionyl-CoA carboxylase alpha chain
LDRRSPSNQSYLLGDKIIEVANPWVDAPGMGFLSENADFARKQNKTTSFYWA